MKMLKIASVLLLSALATNVYAYGGNKSHEDARQMDDATVKTRNIKYSCSTGGSLNVKYGFNRYNLPTYAQASLNGKVRFIPINLNMSDDSSTAFGDENNYYMLVRNDFQSINYNNVRGSTMSVNSPSGEMLHKYCTSGKK